MKNCQFKNKQPLQSKKIWKKYGFSFSHMAQLKVYVISYHIMELWRSLTSLDFKQNRSETIHIRRLALNIKIFLEFS